MSSLEYTLEDGKLVDDIMMDIHMIADIALNGRKKD